MCVSALSFAEETPARNIRNTSQSGKGKLLGVLLAALSQIHGVCSVIKLTRM